jgi:GNAT superfamily N-acetyltransferase
MRAMIGRAAIAYLRNRRASYFFGAVGPELPVDIQARWRVTPEEPHGWHANMVGFVDCRPARLPVLVEIAIDWFAQHCTDTWVDSDEYGVVFGHRAVLDAYGFRLIDNWDAMICHGRRRLAINSAVKLEYAEGESGLWTAALIAEQIDHGEALGANAAAVSRRADRFRREYDDYGTRFVLATLDGRPVGTARLTNEELPLIVGVSTIPSARGQGVATAVTDFLTREALATRGACALYVERDTQAAQIYRRIGYVPLFRSCAWFRAYEPAA